MDIYLKAAAGQDIVLPKKERLLKIGELAKHVMERNSKIILLQFDGSKNWSFPPSFVIPAEAGI